MGCYDKWWLSKDMDNMGYLFEYCDDYCEKLYNVKIDKNKLLKAFIATVSFKTFTLDEWTYISPDNKNNQFTGKSMDYIGAYNLGNKFRIMLERDNGDGFLNNIKASEYFAELLNIIQKN